MTGTHPTVAQIDLSAFRWNFRQVRRRVGANRGVVAVVKANAYGHGLVDISRAAVEEGAAGLGVAFVEEGVLLREAGIGGKILVMAGFLPEEAPLLVQHHLTPVISDSAQVESLDKAAARSGRPAGFHLKLDTGMGRLGLSEGDIPSFIEKTRALKSVEIQGLLSHFADDALDDLARAEDQIERFDKGRQTIESLGLKIPIRHMANSAAIVDLDRAWYEWVRPGIMLYGYLPSSRAASRPDLKPVMTLKTRILHLKGVPAGATVSYGRTFTARRNSRIAVLPIGYGDGFSRAWSNLGQVLIGGRRVPVVGRVCMDMTMVDVTDLSSPKAGDEAVLIGSQGSEALWADELARGLNTIPYEILCGVGARIPRVFRNEEVQP